jgi:hypothetical protein
MVTQVNIAPFSAASILVFQELGFGESSMHDAEQRLGRWMWAAQYIAVYIDVCTCVC